jgi:hypothetical protein
MPLFLRAYVQLLLVESYLRKEDFKGLYERVRNCPIERATLEPSLVSAICEAMDFACIWYWKHALCLQRSAALTCLLRHHGVAANLVIGAQHMPFRSHAWVEVEGRVVNDKPYVGEVFAVLDRC